MMSRGVLAASHRRRAGARGLGLTAVLAVVPLTAVTVLGAGAPAQAATALRTLAEARNKYFGTALTTGDVSNSSEMAVASVQFDMVTPGNEMKWDTTERSNGSYNFGPGDTIVSFAQSHNMRVRGHNLVWHSQLPSWVSSLPTSQVKSVMESHITTEATHYKGKVYAWDVINEPYNEDGSLRGDIFYQAMGSGYLADAIRTAHAADPNAKLYINDYNIEGVNAKSNALYSLAQSMVSQGVPLDGIGLESHFIVGQVPSSLLTNMQRFAALGLDVAITELDDRIQLPASSSTLNQQATDYRTVVNDCLAVTRCVGISQWGVDDGHSWIPGTFSGYGAATMYDSSYQPKPAYTATVAALSGPTTTTTSSTTTTTTTTRTTTTTTTTRSTTSTTSPGTTTTSGGTGGCTAAYSLASSWSGGFVANVTVTAGSAGTRSWKVTLVVPSGSAISNGWNATFTGSTGTVTATNASYNGSLGAGQSTSFGFQGTGTGTGISVSCAAA